MRRRRRRYEGRGGRFRSCRSAREGAKRREKGKKIKGKERREVERGAEKGKLLETVKKVGECERKKEIQIDRQTDIQTDMQTGRQTDKQTDRQTDRESDNRRTYRFFWSFFFISLWMSGPTAN